MDCTFSSASPTCSTLQNDFFGKLQHFDSLSASEWEEAEENFPAIEKFIVEPPEMIVPFMRHHTRSWDRDQHQKRSVSEESDVRMSTSRGNIFTRGLSRISRRKKKQKSLESSLVTQQQTSFETPSFQLPIAEKSTILSKGMDRLRRSLRFNRRRDRSHDRHLSPDVTGGSKSELWQPDEAAVRAGTCCFNVKYLGTVEVFESRGMQTCEGALKSLKASRRKAVKAVLYVSGDGLRVVDQGNSRGLLVDQTIEKVSFCAPDRNTDKGFAYICRDGASRRWMCHGFQATKETGERLSHAVGCAFSICLEKKKKRDEETGASGEPTPTLQHSSDVFHPNWDEPRVESTSTPSSSAQRSNLAYQSFRKHVSIEDRYLDPQSVIVNEVPAELNHSEEMKRIAKPRPSSNPALFQRQGSLRAPDMPSSSDQFKRNLSLRPEKFSSRERKVCFTQICIIFTLQFKFPIFLFFPFPLMILDTEYVRAVVHDVSSRARQGVASKVRALKLAHSRARLRSYSQACEKAAYIDGKFEFYPTLGSTNGQEETELKTLMWQDFRDANVDVDTRSPGYGYGIETGIEIGPICENLMRRRSCPSFGTQLYNEPIMESDEDPLGLGIKPYVPPTNPVSKNGLDGLDLNWKSVPAPIVGLNANGDFANWPSNPPKVLSPLSPLSPLDRLQKQFEDVKIGSTSSGESTPTGSRSKADEWLDDVLRVSMSMSPTPSSSYSVLPKSGPPPAHAPPPLPARQAVSNGSPSIFQNQSARDSPASGINWNSSPNPQQMAQIPSKPVDPFDVQWSKLSTNHNKK